MLNVHILCVGKLKEKFYLEAAAEYAKRLSGYCKLTVTELPEERLPDDPARARIDAALEKEGRTLLSRLAKGGRVAALCVEGELMSSEALADKLRQWTVGGTSQLTLVIGGSYGLSPAVKARADLRLSMSPMTFPHHLARVMVLEQLYRAFKINEGSSYHK